MKKSNDTIGNRTYDLSACSAVPQPTVPMRAPNLCSKQNDTAGMNDTVFWHMMLCSLEDRYKTFG
jgi:hypothetical protein